MILAVFDTNVLVSSLISKRPDSPTVRVVESIYENRIIPLYNKDIILEYEDVLRREKFGLKEEHVQQLLSTIKKLGISIGEPSPTGVELTDSGDVVFYEVTMEKRDDNAYLITGNIRHFPHRDYIVTPAEMMEILSLSERDNILNSSLGTDKLQDDEWLLTNNEGKPSVKKTLRYYSDLIKDKEKTDREDNDLDL